MKRHVVMYSGGVGSWCAAKRVAAEHGVDGMTLLFADTLVEDDDLHRFLDESAANVGAPLVRVQDGRTPFEVFHDTRFLGNARMAKCSHVLKQDPCREWLKANCEPAETTLYVGIDWTEIHRLPAIVKNWSPFSVVAPMVDAPWLSKAGMLSLLRAEGIEPPKGYVEGFPHNNCLMQGCVRGGQAYWKLLLDVRPAVYAETEANEQKMREHLGADVSILRDRSGGESRPMTLREFRERIEAGRTCDLFEWGGCGCFTAVEMPSDVVG